jgi:hypothetical protein
MRLKGIYMKKKIFVKIIIVFILLIVVGCSGENKIAETADNNVGVVEIDGAGAIINDNIDKSPCIP